jgi:hypothetical protein
VLNGTEIQQYFNVLCSIHDRCYAVQRGCDRVPQI